MSVYVDTSVCKRRGCGSSGGRERDRTFTANIMPRGLSVDEVFHEVFQEE